MILTQKRLIVIGAIALSILGLIITSTEVQATPVNSRIAQAIPLRLGMQGGAVTRLQTLLKQRGFYLSPITGSFDPRTQTAVRIAQRVYYGLEQTGVVNAATWQALQNPPQIRISPSGAPPDTDPGGGRGNCAVAGNPLTALVPQLHSKNEGLTVSARPTWFFYIPKTTYEKKLADFSLQDEEGNFIYRTRITLPASAGIISLTIPDSNDSPELQANKNYKWTFSLVCNPRESEPYVTGFIQRVERPDLAAKVKQTALKNVPSVYAEAGIWHEALTSLAQLRREHPGDEFLLLEWTNYLAAANLAYLSTETLLP